MSPAVDAPALAERLGDDTSADPLLIDVRTPAEFETAHIPGAVNVPLDELRGSLDQLCGVLAEHDVVLVCRSGNRAGQAQEALVKAGLSGPRVLTGGLDSWEQTGGDLNRGRQTWALERQVRLTAGALVASAVLGSAAVPRLKWLAGLIGGGLVVAALTDICAMGMALARMPWNRRAGSADGASCPAERLMQRR